MTAFKIASLHLALISLLAFSCAAKQNCSEAQCKVLPVGENLASEFQSKASEKGVRMLYLNLEIGNDRYHPLESKDVFFPERWIWAASIKEPMLRLPYDFDILSLGLLDYQVRSMSVPLEDHPSGCLASLNSSCQNFAVGEALLNNVTRGSSRGLSQETEVVCVEMIEKVGDSGGNSVQYLCCSLNTPSISCDLRVKGSNWFNAIATILAVLSIILFLYYPCLLLALPDCIFNLKNECEREDNLMTSTRNEDGLIGHNTEEDSLNIDESIELAVDDASPITCSTLLCSYVQRLPELRMSFTIKLAVLLFWINPLVIYLQLGLYFAFKIEYFKKLPPSTKLGPVSDFTATFANPNSLSSFITFIAWFLVSLLLVLFLRPKDLILQRNTRGLFLPGYRVIIRTLYRVTLPEVELHNVGDVLRFNLKELQPAMLSSSVSLFLRMQNWGVKKLFSFVTCSLPREKKSRKCVAICILWVLLSIFPVVFLGLAFEALCLLFGFVIMPMFCLVYFSSSVSLILIYFPAILREILTIKNKIVRYLALAFFCLLAISFEFCFDIILLSCNFIAEVLGFTIMGLVLNAEVVTPYVAFFIVIITNIGLCYTNLQNRYMEVKGLILKYRLQTVSQTVSRDQSTIPTNLFWFVCDKAFPLKTEVCLMLSKMTAIVIFLFLVVSSVVFFRNTYNISTVVATIYVFVSGFIPGLFFDGLTKGKNFSGWPKIKLQKEIETAVDEFYSESGNGSNNTEREESSPNQDQVTVL